MDYSISRNQVYNKEKHLSKTIESVLYQSFKDFEIIIINDGATCHAFCVALPFDCSIFPLHGFPKLGASSCIPPLSWVGVYERFPILKDITPIALVV